MGCAYYVDDIQPSMKIISLIETYLEDQIRSNHSCLIPQIVMEYYRGLVCYRLLKILYPKFPFILFLVSPTLVPKPQVCIPSFAWIAPSSFPLFSLLLPLPYVFYVLSVTLFSPTLATSPFSPFPFPCIVPPLFSYFIFLYFLSKCHRSFQHHQVVVFPFFPSPPFLFFHYFTLLSHPALELSISTYLRHLFHPIRNFISLLCQITLIHLDFPFSTIALHHSLPPCFFSFIVDLFLFMQSTIGI